MYLRTLTLTNIKCFDTVTLSLPERVPDRGNWHVILGTNATGKTTLLQAIAAALIGPHAAGRLIESPGGWVRAGETHGEIEATFDRDPEDGIEGHRTRPYTARLAVTGDAPVDLEDEHYAAPAVVALGKDRKPLTRSAWAVDKSGWLLAGYGAFRRFTGGAEAVQHAFGSNREVRVASLFREAFALERSLDWLQRLYARAADRHAPAAETQRHEELLRRVRALVDHLLRDRGVRIADIDTENVHFATVGGARVPMSALSDGFRSFLAFVLDLLRHAHEVYGANPEWIEEREDGVVVHAPGVVLIDEVDSHLHPVWQREIARSLTAVFRRTQFIVTSHSPLIAQAASDRGLFVLHHQHESNRVILDAPEPSVKGWTVNQILVSPLFGLTETRSAEVDALLKRHATLVGQRLAGPLSPEAQTELKKIEAQLSATLSAPGDSVEERRRNIAMEAFIDETLNRFQARGS